MTEQKKLKELMNNIRVTGTLKSVDLEVKPNKKDPKVKQIMGSIVVMVEDAANGRVHEHEINLFAKDSSKLFKGYNTVKNEFKAADVVGKENADRVTVVGSIDENLYMGQDGELREFNRNRGLFVNRVTEQETADEAIAQIELVITGLREKTDSEGIETGEFAIDAFTVGYNNGVTKLRNLVVGTDLADVITENYEVDSTGKLTFAMNNYVEFEEQEDSDPFEEEEGGFGVQVDISNGPIKKYVRELRVIGGFPPYADERALEEEDIKFAKQIRALKVQEVKNSVPATPPASQSGAGGFGVNTTDPFASDGTIDISDDDLPF
jgi:hypothetical protein